MFVQDFHILLERRSCG